MRGIGEARQSCSFTFKKLLLLPRLPAPIAKGGPQHPVRLALYATLYLLREVEVSTARISAWTLDHEECELWWNLPASKADHMALGVKRHWPSTCGLYALFCPYHLAVVHLEWLQTLGSPGSSALSRPAGFKALSPCPFLHQGYSSTGNR